MVCCHTRINARDKMSCNDDNLLWLPPRSLMLLLHTIYQSEDPLHELLTMLKPYRIDREQTESVKGQVFWPVVALRNNPLLHLIERWHKKTFTYVATSISHIWCTSVHPVARIHPEQSHICCYEDTNVPIPYIWFNFDPHYMIHKMDAHSEMCAIDLDLYRQTELGEMLPLHLEYKSTKQSTTNSVSLACTVTNTYRIELDVNIKNSRARNFLVIFSHGGALKLIKCMLVSPSTKMTWCAPVILHNLTLIP